MIMITSTNKTVQFAILYKFFDESHETEISMMINGNNILSFENDGRILTTRWNIDGLALWLREFLNHMEEDPYPVEAEGEYAAIKDINARNFDSDDDEEFDAYYDKLDEWNFRHRWHPASDGAIVADLYFQLIGENVEISWNNCELEDGVCFKYKLGGKRIPKEQFVSVINSFLKAYANHWF